MATEGWYTFGNHFHWVGMQWLWGTGVIGRSIDDMLVFIERTGSPGNINFDSNAYEKLASEDPAALDRLRGAIADGRVEVVGGTFGQPYGLFHHGESAVRQLSYGVRSAQRVLGVRPVSFWEEEFCFFPQLPQLLQRSGYRYASLFFQWTWHTPELPKETAPAIRWQGVDGSEVLALPRNDLNLHQWPEDVAALVASGRIQEAGIPVVQQWLELLPSPDWMCRSELVVPGVQHLFESSGVDFRTGTLSTVLDALEPHAQPRRYGMDEVFHGMSIGKNGNLHHRRSAEAEHTLLAAEAFSVLAGDLGRPYAHWGKYPAWELEEGWRELLAFQAHDNDECEGLNGHVGYLGLDRGVGLGAHVLHRTLVHLANTTVEVGERIVANPLGWARDAVVDGRRGILAPFGTTPVAAFDGPAVPAVAVHRDGGEIVLEREGFQVRIDAGDGSVTSVGPRRFAAGTGRLEWRRNGVRERFTVTGVRIDGSIVAVDCAAGDAVVTLRYRLADEIDALDLSVSGDLGDGPDRRYHASLVLLLLPESEIVTLRHDTPYAVGAIEARNERSRKYPTGAWMTSPQEFETVHDVFTGLQFVDLLDDDGSGLLWAHDGAQGFHRVDGGIAGVLSMRDPWDEDHFVSALSAAVRLIPHGAERDSWRWRRAQEFLRPPMVATAQPTIKPRIEGLAGHRLAGFEVDATAGSAVTAMYRDSDSAAGATQGHANHLARQPVILRVVELDGEGSPLRIRFDRAPLRAWRCSPLGEVESVLDVVGIDVTVDLAPHEIATIAVEFPAAPGEERTLDGDRSIWATVHHDAPTERDH